MKKTYPIEVDCANCANLMEDAAKKTEGVADAVVNFMTQKMTVEFADGQDPKTDDEGRFEELQKGRGRLRDLPVRSAPPRGQTSGRTSTEGFPMTKKQKKMLYRILAAAVLFLAAEIDSPAGARLLPHSILRPT